LSDIPFPTNLLPQYQSPQAMALSAAQTQNAQASAANTEALTQGAQITNQKSALQLGLLQNFLQGQPSSGDGSAPAPGPASNGNAPIGSTGAGADDVTSNVFSQFAPVPSARPANVTARIYQANVAGLPEVGNAIGAQYDASVAGENQRRVLGANAAYQTADNVANAPGGAAFETLDRVQPQLAAILKQKYANDTPAQLDADVRAYANHFGAAVHQYAGRETVMENGVLIDKPSGKTVVGTNQILTGLTAADKQKAFEAANEPVTIGDQLPQPRWKAEGFASPEAFVISADKAARSSAAQQGPAPSAPNGATGGNLVSPPASSPPAQPAPKAASPAPASATADPVLKDALADTSYRYQPPPAPKNQSELAANTEAGKNNQTAINSLKTSSDEVSSASAKALQYFNAAKTILAQPESNWATGIPGDVNAMLAKLGIPTDASTTRAEAVKNLTQAALQGLKTTYGSKPAMFDVKVNLEQAFPDIKGDQGLPAVKNLIDENIRNLNYDLASGRRVRSYLSVGNDPTQFNTWNEDKFSRTANVNPGGSRGPQAIGAPASAVAYLQQHPEAAPQFKAKYGYLPGAQ
jgi:hypothetical protein